MITIERYLADNPDAHDEVIRIRIFRITIVKIIKYQKNWGLRPLGPVKR